MPLKDVNHEDTKRGKHNGPRKHNESWKLESKQKSVTGHVLASPRHPVCTRQGGYALLCTACRFLGWRWCSQAPNVKSPDTGQDARWRTGSRPSPPYERQMPGSMWPALRHIRPGGTWPQERISEREQQRELEMHRKERLLCF